jgi:hypothetical protein
MPNVPYPGNFLDKDNNFDTCVEYLNDPLTITFTDTGMIFPTATGIFSPDLPIGIFTAGVTIGPYTPVSNNKQLVVYYKDFKSNKMYKNTIIICTKCNSPSDSKCA